eukprot:Skav236168  [mRNA]  locus=scaffold298:273670:276849:+ [translate_table: standard]
MTENLTNAVNVSIYNKYIHTPITTNAQTVRDAISKGHYIDNECWINLLTDFYADTIMNERTRKRLTREKVIEIIGRNDFHEKGASIQEMEAVFKAYGLQVRIYNLFTSLIYKYDPPKRNHHIKTLYAMVKNNHIYALNHDLKSIQQKQDGTMPIVRATTDYYLNEKDEPPKFRMIKYLNDILKLEVDEKEKEVYLVPELNNLHELFFEVIKSGYEPRITFQAGIITDIRLKLDDVKYIIKTQNLIKSSADGCITVRDEQTYNRMNEAMFKFNKSLINPQHRSFYNDIDLKILDETRTIPPLGLFYDKGSIPDSIIELDRCKAYTKAFIDITWILVFNQFDTWRVYDDTVDFKKLHRLTLYRVKVHSMSFLDRTKILFNKEFNLITGEILKELPERVMRRVEILAYKEPSFKHKVNYKSIVKELWNTVIDEADKDEDKFIKKLIANVNYGLLEKGGSTSQRSIVFRNLKEAVNSQTEYGGKIHKLTHVEEEVKVGEEQGKCWNSSSQTEQEAYYILNLKDRAQLKNGYRYIKELLLQKHNLAMYKAYYGLKDAGITVYSVKTDAFTIKAEDEEKARRVLDFHDDIGGWRVSKYDDIKLPTVKYEVIKNQSIEIPIYENEESKSDDEYDTDDIISKIDEKKTVMIKAVYAGSDKSYIPKHMKDRKVLFIVPTNNLSQECGVEAITVNKFFGFGVKNEKFTAYDYSDYDVLVFDEIYFNSIPTLVKIKELVDNNTDKIIIATGDTNQLPSVSEVSNTKDYQTYMDDCINQIFKYFIELKICKRLNTEEDKLKLENMYHDILKTDMPFTEIIEKYFSYTEEIENCDNNIAYTNATCKKVSREIRKMKNIKDEFILGDLMICRNYMKTKHAVFNVNITYEITKINDAIITLKNVKTLDEQTIHISYLRKNFIYANAYTAHSKQGCSIDGDIVIYDWQKWYVSRQWFYTALTRSRDFNKVKFYKYEVEPAISKKEMKQYFKNKVDGYKQQDLKAGRMINEREYIDEEWLMSKIGQWCPECHEPFTFEKICGYTTSTLTAQRLENEEGHYMDNCICMCAKCNSCLR